MPSDLDSSIILVSLDLSKQAQPRFEGWSVRCSPRASRAPRCRGRRGAAGQSGGKGAEGQRGRGVKAVKAVRRYTNMVHEEGIQASKRDALESVQAIPRVEESESW